MAAQKQTYIPDPDLSTRQRSHSGPLRLHTNIVVLGMAPLIVPRIVRENEGIDYCIVMRNRDLPTLIDIKSAQLPSTRIGTQLVKLDNLLLRVLRAALYVR
jgi:hypothetical protein